MADPFPIARYLTPVTPTPEPEGFTVIDRSLSGGLPARVALTAELTLVVGIATGLANAWREADPQATVTSSLAQWQPYAPASSDGPAPDAIACAPRLILIRSGSVVAAAPAVAAARHLVPASGDPELGTLLELYVSAWDIRAGSIVGAGDVGSRIRFGWRIADAASTQFMPPPISPNIISRLKDRRQTQSQLGSSVKRASAGYGVSVTFTLLEELTVGQLLSADEYFGDPGRLVGLPLSWERS
jgi:hypothetical protein